MWLTPVTIILLLVNYLILLPSSLRFMRSAWSIRDETYMKARQLYISLICAFSLLTIITIHPILLCLKLWSVNQTIDAIVHILVIILSIIPLIGTALRLWLFYYAHKYTDAIFKERRIHLQREKKLELINNSNGATKNRQSVSPFVSTPNSTQPQPSFDGVNLSQLNAVSNGPFLQSALTTTSAKDIIKMESTLTNPLQFWINNRHKFGSFIFMRYFILLLISLDIIFVIIIYLVLNIGTLIAYLLQSIIFVILFIFIQFHVYKLSPFRDEFFVRKQFVTEVRIIYFNVFLWIICLIAWYYNERQANNNNIGIAIRLLLNTNMSITCFLLILAQFAIPMFRFQEGIETLSNRNVLKKSKYARKRLKISLFECITQSDGYYLFLEYLMKEFSVENLLFITEAAYMKEKFQSTVLVPRIRRKSKSNSNSVASSLKNAFYALSERKRSAEPSISNEKNANTKHVNVPSTSTSTVRNLSATNRLKKLRDIPSNDAIVSTQSEVDNIMNKSADEVVEENKSNNIEMGVINGKPLTISTAMFKATATATLIINDQRNKLILPKLPHTVTMAESMKQNNLFDSVDMIYDNFIDKNAKYQINISATSRIYIMRIVIQHRLSVEAQREKLRALNVDRGRGDIAILPSQLSGIIVDIHIFDKAIHEILALLRSSFYRFAQTKQYKIYCNVMAK